MALDGYTIARLFREREAADKSWRALAGDYWQKFIHSSKDRGFTIHFNDKNKEIEILKEGKKIVSLYFLKEMLKEDIDIRYSLEIHDKMITEGSEEREMMKYLKSMKGKDEKEIVSGLKKKFKLGQDDAERALELIK